MPVRGHCPRCDYDCAPLIDPGGGIRAWITCPECGHTMQQGVLLRPWRQTRRRTFPAWVRFVILAIAAVFAFMFVATLIPSLITAFKP